MGRYKGVSTKFDVDLRRRVRGMRFRPEINEELVFTIYLEDGDTFESLAYKYYGSEDLWWIIADQNPLVHPFYLTAGTRVKILKRSALPAGRQTSRYGEIE